MIISKKQHSNFISYLIDSLGYSLDDLQGMTHRELMALVENPKELTRWMGARQ